MIKNLQEIRQALAVKLGLARSNEQRAKDQEGLEEREAFEALQAVEIDWQKANEGLRANLHRTQVAETQERLRKRSAEKDAIQEVGGMFGKNASPTEPEIEPKEQVSAPPSRKDDKRPRKHTGLFSEQARLAEPHERDNVAKGSDDQEKLRAERLLRKARANAEARAFLRRERQQDRSLGRSR